VFFARRAAAAKQESLFFQPIGKNRRRCVQKSFNYFNDLLVGVTGLEPVTR